MTSQIGPVLSQINLVARDVDRMAEFYRELGVTISHPPAPWAQHHRRAEMPQGPDLELDSSQFAPLWNEGWPAGASGVIIGFRLSDRDAVDHTYAKLIRAGYRAQQAPYDAFWGARYAVVEDPDGNPVGLMSPVVSGWQTEPPHPPD